ncbi:hypothetical protein FALBO_15285 [Fusarium albosuccineum]|uniref:Uncharacterized protein n=1 Tax=Fusarium albosuccineum TaxID=1237068 RepID=A0A8H4KXA5_9HYPO|nr:hypothetical protein FALBO_15285 [Fusarium albosuccineum]
MSVRSRRVGAQPISCWQDRVSLPGRRLAQAVLFTCCCRGPPLLGPALTPLSTPRRDLASNRFTTDNAFFLSGLTTVMAPATRQAAKMRERAQTPRRSRRVASLPPSVAPMPSLPKKRISRRAEPPSLAESPAAPASDLAHGAGNVAGVFPANNQQLSEMLKAMVRTEVHDTLRSLSIAEYDTLHADMENRFKEIDTHTETLDAATREYESAVAAFQELLDSRQLPSTPDKALDDANELVVKTRTAVSKAQASMNAAQAMNDADWEKMKDKMASVGLLDRASKALS